MSGYKEYCDAKMRVCLEADIPINLDEYEFFAKRAAEMFYGDKTKRDINYQRFTGTLRMTNQCVLYGTSLGREYTANLNVAGQVEKSKFKLIVCSDTSLEEFKRN
jgi:hypothetical protein